MEIQEGSNSHRIRKSSKHRHHPVDLQHPLSVELPPDSQQPEAPHYRQQPEVPRYTQQPEAPRYTQQPESLYHTQQPEAPDHTQPRERLHQPQQRDGSRHVWQLGETPYQQQPGQIQQLQSGVYHPEFHPADHTGVHGYGEINRGYDPRYESQPVQCITSQPTSVTYPQWQQFNQGAERPAHHTCLAAFVCLCCCWPLGLVASLSARKALSEFNKGNVAAAKSASKKALTLSVLGMVIGVCVLVSVIAVAILKGGTVLCTLLFNKVKMCAY